MRIHLVLSLLLLVTLAQASIIPYSHMVLPDAATPTSQTEAELLGSNVVVTLTVQNTGTALGYQPFVDIVFPSNFSAANVSPNATNTLVRFLDYTSFSLFGVDVSNFDKRVTTFPLTFNNDTAITPVCVAHPFIDLSNGSKALICGKPGDYWISVLLPILLLGPTSPLLEITLTMSMRRDSPIGTPLPVYYRAGFWAGSTAALDPSTDPSIVINSSPNPNEWTSTEGVSYIIPSPFTVKLAFSSSKFATGPSFPQTATLTMSIAKSITLTNVTISTAIPATFQVTSVSPISPSPSSTQLPTFSGIDSKRVLGLNYTSLLGTSGTDISAVINFYVPQFDAYGLSVLDPKTGNPRDESQSATVVASFTSPTTGLTTTFSVSSALMNTSLRSIVIYKSMQIASDWSSNGASPRDRVLHDLSVQVSDYFAFSPVIISDTISDGQSLNSSYAHQLDIHYPNNQANISNFKTNAGMVISASTPVTYVTYNISYLLPTQRYLNNTMNILTGPVTYCHVTYQTDVLIDWKDTSRTSNVNQGDWISDSAVLHAQIVDSTKLTPFTIGAPSDDSDSASMRMAIAPQTLTLQLYGFDGQVCSPNPCQQTLFTSGEDLTYRILYYHPSTDFTGFSLSVVEPSHKNPVTVFNPTALMGVPAPGTSCYGFTDTYHNTLPTATKAPTITSSSYPLSFAYVDNRETGVFPTLVDLLYTITIDDTPYRGVYFNYLSIAKSIENGFPGTSVNFIKVRTPYPTIMKGVISSSGVNSVFSQNPPIPATYTANLNSCPVVSQNITASAVNFDSDVSNVFGGDTVTFMISVINQGTGDTFGLTIKDEIPTGFMIPLTGLNLCVWRGDHTAISWQGTDPTQLFTTGLKFNDLNSQKGVLSAGLLTLNPDVLAAHGENALFITYRLQANALAVETGTTTMASASITRYAASLTGTDFVAPLSLVIKDPVNIAYSSVNVSVWLSSTSLPETTWTSFDPWNTDLAVGEVASFYASMIFPYGVTSNALLVVTLPTGLQLINGTVFALGSVVASLKEGDSGVIANNAIIFSLGNVYNDPLSLGGAFMTETYAVVKDIPANTAGTTLTVSASVTSLSLPLAKTDSVTMDLVEGALTLSKSASPSTNVQAGSTVTFTVVLAFTAASSGPAYNVTINDALPWYLSLANASVTPTSLGGTLTSTSSGITYFLPTYALGSSSVTITMTTTVLSNTTVGITLSNTATGTWKSAPQALVASTVRSYTLQPATVSFLSTLPTITWTINATSLAATTTPSVAVGETVTYRISVTVPAGQTGFRLTVALPNATASGYMGVLTSHIVSVSSTMANGQSFIGASGIVSDVAPSDGIYETLVFDFGNNQLVDSPSAVVLFEFVALVNNATANARGVRLQPSATLRYGSSSQFSSLSATATALTIVEPSFNTATRTSNVTSVNGADAISFQVSISWSSITNDGPAYNFTVTDALHSSLQLVVGSVSGSYVASGVTTPLTVVTGNTAGDTTISLISGTGVALYRYSGSLIITYSAKIIASVSAGSSIATTANLYWWSTPDSYSPRRYTTTTSTTLTVKSPSVASFVYFNSSILPMTSGRARAGYNDITVGQTITLRCTVSLPLASTNLTTQLVTMGSPTTTTLSITSSRMVSLTSGISGSLITTGDTGVLTRVSASDPYLSKVTWTHGNLQTSDSLQSIVMEVVLFVNDVTANIDYRIFQPKVTITGPTFTSSSATLNFEIVEPRLTLAQSVPTSLTRDAGDAMPFTFIVSHLKTSSISNATAYLANFANSFFPNSVVLQPGTVSLSSNYPIIAGMNYIGSGNNAGESSVSVSIYNLTLVSTTAYDATISFNATLSNNVVIGTNFYNNGTVTYNSAPNAVSPYGRSYTSSALSSVFVYDTTTLSQAFTATSVSQLPLGLQATVGQTMNVTLTVTVPEGVIKSLLVVYDLAPVGFQTGRMQLLSSRIAFWGSKLTSSFGMGMGSLGSLQDGSFSDGIADRVAFNLGDVTNAATNVKSRQDTLDIEVMMLVLNDTHNAQGVQFAGAANYTQLYVSTPVRIVSSAITIQEPSLSITVQVLNPTTYWNAGDVVQYSLLVSHITSGGRISYSPAFSVNVQDLSSTSLLLVQPGTVTLSPNYPLSASNKVTSGNTAGDTSVVVDVSPMLLGSSGSTDLNITFSAVIANAAVIGTNITNPASLVYYSVPASSGTGRRYTASSQTTISLLDTSSLQHVVSSKSVPQFSATQTSVGEAISFQVTMTFPEGTSVNVSLTHDLAPPEYRNCRLRLVNATVTFMGSQLSSSNGIKVGSTGVTKDSSFADGILDQVTFNLGTITNTYDNLNTQQDTLVITVTGVVIDNSVYNFQGVTVGATASFTNAYRSSPIRLVTSAITIQEPLLSVKTEIVGQNTTVWEGGDEVPIVISIQHVKGASPQSHSGAFNLRITDIFGNGLYLLPGTVVLSPNYPSTPGVNVITSGNSVTDTAMTVDIAYMPLLADTSADITITVRAVVREDVLIMSYVDNLVSLQYYSVPTNGLTPSHSYSAEDGLSVYIKDTSYFNHAITTKTVPQLPTTATTPGEFLTIRIGISLPEGTLPAVNITEDVAPSDFQQGRMQIVSSNITYMSSSLSSSKRLKAGSTGTLKDLSFNDNILDTAIFDFGDLTNLHDDVKASRDSLVLEILVLVLDHQNNVQDVQLSAAASFSQSRRVSPYISLLPTLTVQEPNVTVAVTIPNGVALDRCGGDAVPFLISVNHLKSPSPSISHSTAFLLSVTDSFNSNLLLKSGTVTLSPNYPVNGGSATISSGNNNQDSSAVVDISIFPLVADTSADLTIQLNATVSPVVIIGASVDNPVTIRYYSSPRYKGQQYGRVYTASATISFPIRDTATLTQLLVSTSLPYTPDGPPTYSNIGETLTYMVTLTVPAGVLQNVQVAHNLAPPEDVGKWSVYSTYIDLGSRISTSTGLATGSSPVIGTDAQGVNYQAVWNLGTLTTVPVQGVTYSTATITFNCTALILNNAINVNDTKLTLATDITRDSASAQRLLAPSVTVIEPILQIQKSQSVSKGDAGDIITYTYLITHTSNSASVAFNVKLTDPGHPMLDIQSGSMVISNALGATVLAGNSSSDTGINVLITSMPLRGGPVVISYNCYVSPLAEANAVITTQATINYTSAIDPLLSRLGSAVSNSVQFQMNDVQLVSFAVVTSSLGQSGKVLTSPGTVPGLVVGETAIFRTVISVPEGVTSDAFVTVAIPPGLQAVSATVSSLGGMTSFLTAGSPGSLLPGHVDFLLGTITNPADGVISLADDLVLDVVLEATDQPFLVTNGTVLAPTVSLSYDLDGGTSKNASTSVEIVEPNLALEVLGSVNSVGLDEIEYTVRVSVPLDSTAPAFNVVVTDLVSSAALTLVVGSVTASSGRIEMGNGASDTTVRVTLDRLVPGASDVVIRFLAKVDPALAPATPIGNSAQAVYNSLPSGNIDGRSYVATGSFFTPLNWPQLGSFIIVSTSIGETAQTTTNADLAIGETITFRMSFTVPLQMNAQVPITATVNTNPSSAPTSALLRVIGAEVYYLTPGVTTQLKVGDPGRIVDSVGDRYEDSAIFEFGIPTYNTTVNGNYEFQVQVYAIVLDVPENDRGDIVYCTGTLDYQVAAKFENVVLQVVEPSLILQTTLDRTVGDAGDPFVITSTISHLSKSNSPAYLIDLTFALDPNLVPPTTFTVIFFPVSQPSYSTTAQPSVDITGQLSVRVPLLKPTDRVQIIGTLIAADLVEPSVTMQGATMLYYQSSPYPNSGGRNNTEVEVPSNYTRNWSIHVPGPSISLTLSNTSQPHTLNRNLTIFEEASFFVRAVLPEGFAKDVDIVSVISRFLNYTDRAGKALSIRTSKTGDLLCNADVSGNNGVPCENLDLTGRINLLSKYVANTTDVKEISVFLGNVVNLNRDNAVSDWIELYYTSETELCPRRSILTDTPFLLWTQTPSKRDTLSVTDTGEVLVSNLPELAITETLSETSLKDGQLLVITLRIFHSDASDVDAFNVVVSDVLPAGVNYVNASYKYISGVEPEAFDSFLPNEDIAFGSTPHPASPLRNVLGWYIPSLPLSRDSIIQFAVRLNVAEVNKSSPVLTFRPSVGWSSIPSGPRIWSGDYNGGLPGQLNSTSLHWEALATGDSICIGGLVVAGAALAVGYRGGVYANDGWMLVDHFQFVAISAALGVDWLDVWCGHYLGWSSCFSWTLFQVNVPWDLAGKYFHFLIDAGYAFKSSSDTIEPDGKVYPTRSDGNQLHYSTRDMEDYSWAIALPMEHFVLSFVFYFCIVFIVLAICFVLLLLLSKLIDCLYFGGRKERRTGSLYAGHHGPHGLHREGKRDDDLEHTSDDHDDDHETHMNNEHETRLVNPLFVESMFSEDQEHLERALEKHKKKYSFSVWFPWFINSSMLLFASGLVRLATLGYLPATISGFLTLYLVAGGWDVPALYVLMGILCIIFVLAMPVLFFLFWLIVLKLQKPAWLFEELERARTIRHVLGALYADYEQRYAWFFLVVMVRKLLVGAAVGLLWQAPGALIFIVMVLYAIYIILLLIFRPYNRNKWGHRWYVTLLPGMCERRMRLKWSYWVELWSLVSIPIVLFIEWLIYLIGNVESTASGFACLMMIWLHILVFVGFFILATPAWVHYLYRLVMAGCGCIERTESDDGESTPSSPTTTPNPFFDESAEDNPPIPAHKKKFSIPQLILGVTRKASKASSVPQDKDELEILTPRAKAEYDRYRASQNRKGSAPSAGKKKSVTMTVNPETGEMRRASLFDVKKIKQIYGQIESSSSEEEREREEEKKKEKEKTRRLVPFRRKSSSKGGEDVDSEKEKEKGKGKGKGKEKEKDAEEESQVQEVEHRTVDTSTLQEAEEVDFGALQRQQRREQRHVKPKPKPKPSAIMPKPPRDGSDLGASDIKDEDL